MFYADTHPPTEASGSTKIRRSCTSCLSLPLVRTLSPDTCVRQYRLIVDVHFVMNKCKFTVRIQLNIFMNCDGNVDRSGKKDINLHPKANMIYLGALHF